ncbi:hypothetical protein R1sor_018487 [Riccia sorocarpa]|uniref:CCHC-type domain-containing protein n=1 Tax=Riccia sorocarpa TaxID=122646 RepID=A0ABD3IDF0_9MARC
MVRFTHADSDGDELDDEDIEGDEEDCDDDPKKVESEYSYPIQDNPAMNPAVVMTNVSQEDGGERGNPPVPQSSAPQGEQLSQAPPVARSRGTRCCGACKQPGHTRRTCPALRQYRRAEVQEGLDVAADG